MAYSLKYDKEMLLPERVAYQAKEHHKLQAVTTTKDYITFIESIEQEQPSIINILCFPLIEDPSQKLISNQIQCKVEKDSNWWNPSRVIASHFEDQDCFLVLNNPIQLYFFTQKAHQAIQIHLDSKIDLQETICNINYPNVFLYGHSPSQSSNCIFSINLMTFEVKQICNGKGYSPKGRKKHFSHFSEDRLYVFGGVDLKGNLWENLLWTFDFEKGYWFALQIKSDEIFEAPYSCCQIESGKVLILKNNRMHLLELYQSRIIKLNEEIPEQLNSKQQRNMFVLNKLVYFYDHKICPGAISIERIKLTKEAI